jgi:hypothetical protein
MNLKFKKFKTIRMCKNYQIIYNRKISVFLPTSSIKTKKEIKHNSTLTILMKMSKIFLKIRLTSAWISKSNNLLGQTLKMNKFKFRNKTKIKISKQKSNKSKAKRSLIKKAKSIFMSKLTFKIS